LSETVAAGTPTIIEVERKRTGLTKGVGRVFGMLAGIGGIFIGALLCVTIVGIPLGFPLMFLSLGLIYLVAGKQAIKCPHCAKKQPVLQTAENFTCGKCRQLTVINWR